MALESGVAELQRFARGLSEAKEQILNFCEHRAAPAPASKPSTPSSAESSTKPAASPTSTSSSSNSARKHCKGDKAPENDPPAEGQGEPWLVRHFLPPPQSHPTSSAFSIIPEAVVDTARGSWFFPRRETPLPARRALTFPHRLLFPERSAPGTLGHVRGGRCPCGIEFRAQHPLGTGEADTVFC